MRTYAMPSRLNIFLVWLKSAGPMFIMRWLNFSMLFSGSPGRARVPFVHGWTFFKGTLYHRLIPPRLVVTLLSTVISPGTTSMTVGLKNGKNLVPLTRMTTCFSAFRASEMLFTR